MAPRVPFEIDLAGSRRSPDMLAPAIMPVHAGKNTPNTIWKLACPVEPSLSRSVRRRRKKVQEGQKVDKTKNHSCTFLVTKSRPKVVVERLQRPSGPIGGFAVNSKRPEVNNLTATQEYTA